MGIELLPAFDSTLGTLTGATITYDYSWEAAFRIIGRDNDFNQSIGRWEDRAEASALNLYGFSIDLRSSPSTDHEISTRMSSFVVREGGALFTSDEQCAFYGLEPACDQQSFSTNRVVSGESGTIDVSAFNLSNFTNPLMFDLESSTSTFMSCIDGNLSTSCISYSQMLVYGTLQVAYSYQELSDTDALKVVSEPQTSALLLLGLLCLIFVRLTPATSRSV